jgi:hypothetical protein
MAIDVVGSKMKPEDGPGQNGFDDPSSDLPGEHTVSGFLPSVSVPVSDWQTRPVSAEQKVPTTFGMKAPGEAAKIPAANIRRASTPSTNRSFQR